MKGLPFPRPKKRLGQNFLTDQNISRKIVASANLTSLDTVLEIGPGCGALTRLLCQAASKVIAVEVDEGLVSFLQDTCPDCPNLDLHHADALDFSFSSLPPNSVVVANLPYHISSPLLFTMFEGRENIHRMVLMMQLEVAQRVVAQPRTRTYGILSVCSQYFSNPTILFKIPPTCFSPRPEVDSALVQFVIRKDRSSGKEDEKMFVRVVRAAFAHRRKTLVNSFRDSGVPLSEIEKRCGLVGIDTKRRAETMTVQEFIALAQTFTQECNWFTAFS